MAAVSENRTKRGHRIRQTHGKRSSVKHCNACGSETRWVSVDGMCWECTIQAANNKTPLYMESQEEDLDSTDLTSGLFSEL